jgi:RHS repeat-associated protein
VKHYLGSTALVTNASGGQVSYTRYYPYGRTRTQAGTPPTDKLYTGQQRETAGGVYHYRARMYSADTGRFPQADTVVPDARDPRGLNRYAYAYNSPAVYTDPTGLAVREEAINALLEELVLQDCWKLVAVTALLAVLAVGFLLLPAAPLVASPAAVAVLAGFSYFNAFVTAGASLGVGSRRMRCVRTVSIRLPASLGFR